MQPLHACEVDVGFLAQIHPYGRNRLTRFDWHNTQAHARVGLPGKRVAVIFLRACANNIAALVNDAINGDVRLVGLLERQRAAVGRPPEAVVAVHFLLRGIFGQAVGFASAARVVGELARRGAAVGGHNIQLGIAHVGDPCTIGRKLGRERRCDAARNQPPQWRIGPILNVDIAA